jgi:adenylate cyclase
MLDPSMYRATRCDRAANRKRSALAAIERGRRTDDGHALALLYDLYEARILSYQESPPPENWNGAYALLTK